MSNTTYYIDSDTYLTAIIRDKYLEALERDPKASIQQLIADFIEEYLNNKSKALLE